MRTDVEDIDEKIHAIGWAVMERAVDVALLERMRNDLDFAYTVCRAAQRAGGVADATEGTLHHLPALYWRSSFIDFIDRNASAPAIRQFFGGHHYILQSMGGNFNFPDAANYAGVVHRDIRSYFKDRLMLNTLVALDDLTAENGATWLMVGGHLVAQKPSEEDFAKHAVQVTAPAGSILMWDSRVWHRAGVNRTRAPRRIVTPIFTRPFYKQGLDYPRAIGYNAELSENLRQLLGYNARVPASMEEWYRPPAARMYVGSQG